MDLVSVLRCCCHHSVLDFHHIYLARVFVWACSVLLSVKATNKHYPFASDWSAVLLALCYIGGYWVCSHKALTDTPTRRKVRATKTMYALSGGDSKSGTKVLGWFQTEAVRHNPSLLRSASGGSWNSILYGSKTPVSAAFHAHIAFSWLHVPHYVLCSSRI